MIKTRSIFLRVSIFLLISTAINISTPVAAQEVEIRIADSKGDWGAPNPFHHYPRGPGYVRMSWVFDTLIWKDQSGYIPALATKWLYDPERMVFCFHLNPKAKWHDNTPLTAADVVFTLAYFKKHPYHWISTAPIKTAKVLNPYSVEIHLSTPYASFLSDIGGSMPILPRHIWEKVKEPHSFSAPEAFIGSGPYRFVDFNKAQGSYLFKAFADYYQGRPKADRLIYFRSGRPLVSLSTRQADLCSIDADMAQSLKDKGFVVIQNERGVNRKLMINHRKAPFNQKNFRHALALAIDRQEIIAKSQRGFGTPASYGLLSIDHPMYNPDTPVYHFNLSEARRLLETLGYQRGADGFYHREGQPLEVQLLSSGFSATGQGAPDRDAQVIKKQLENLGIRIELVALEQTTADSKIQNWAFDLAVSGHGGLCGDAKILNEMIASSYGAGSVNSARYDENPELNQLLEMQMREMDKNARTKIVYRIQELYAKELPAISLYYPLSLSAYNPHKGIDWFYTKGGIGKGIPIAQNKMSLIRP